MIVINATSSNLTCIKVMSGLLALLVIPGCASIAPTAPFVVERNGIDMVSSTSNLQSTFFKDEKDRERFCASRPSDVADTRSEGASLAVSLGEEIGEKNSQGAVSLGGRNPAVLITREILYRACEFTLNHNTTTEQSIQIYQILLDAATKMSVNQTSTGTASFGQSPQMPNFQQSDKPIPKPLSDTDDASDSDDDNDTESDSEDDTDS